MLLQPLILAVIASRAYGQAAPAAAGQAAPANDEHILNFVACKDDIHKHCSGKDIDLTSDMSVLECLQDVPETDEAGLSHECEDLVWQFKVKLTQDARFLDAGRKYCDADIKKMPDLSACLQLPVAGEPMSCMISFMYNVTKGSDCQAFLVRTAKLAFSDFRLIGPFVKACNAELDKYNCRKITPNKAHEKVRVPHSQGMALECLIQAAYGGGKTNPDEKVLGDTCQHEVMRLAEMQAEDWHLDRQLFFACREERERYCKEVPAGQGKVFECLLFNRHDKFMRPNCSSILAERAVMMGRDYRMAHPLTKACAKEMRDYSCEPQSQLEAAAHFHLNYILLCIEAGAHRLKDRNPPSVDCQRELLAHRQLMINEFKIAPEVVYECGEEVDKFCSPRGDIEAEGKTLHCLMEHAQARDDKKRVSDKCMQALGVVIKAADIASNYKIDTVLYKSCATLLDGPCSTDTHSEQGALTCLMKHVDNSDMTPECEQRLLEVQYFFARDWTLDPKLYDTCHADAVKACHAPENWHDLKNAANKVDPGPSILACLYRNSYDQPSSLSQPCVLEVHRIIRERAIRVKLLPELEHNCRFALSEYCSTNVQPDEELKCLQEQMHKEEFARRHPQCQKVVQQFTEFQAKDTKLNQLVTHACKPVILSHCAQFEKEDIDHGDVLQCLLQNKDSPQMNKKCRTYVNHFELLTMRDYHLSVRFHDACKKDVEKHCSQFKDNKAEIIRCLSSLTFEHRVLGVGEDLDRECRKQLKVAFLQQEQVDFDDKEHMNEADPKFFNECSRELQQFNCNKKDTFEETVECLRPHLRDLGPQCQSLILQREEIEAADNTMDDELQHNCDADIRKFCGGVKENAVECLSNMKIVRLLQPKCLKIVSERMREAAKDVRLRPQMLQACVNEAQQYCPNEYKKVKDPKYAVTFLEGSVLNCLREKFRQSLKEKLRLGDACRAEISRMILEAEFDSQLDPPLHAACKNVIEQHCNDAIIARSGAYENVLECLKADFYSSLITDPNCNKEIALRTQEQMVDIHLDPILYDACGIDYQRICNGVQPGSGRVIACLMDAAEKNNPMMTQPCRAKIIDRSKLWKKAHNDYDVALPGSLSELAAAIDNHPQRTSILMYMSLFVFIVLLIGCCFGRMTKRVHQELKNR